jgi:hypothetical protein
LQQHKDKGPKAPIYCNQSDVCFAQSNGTPNIVDLTSPAPAPVHRDQLEAQFALSNQIAGLTSLTYKKVPTQKMLDQDYVHHSASVQTQQLVGPIAIPTHTQRQSFMPHTPSLPACGQDNLNHKTYMIDKLRAHIRDSLMSIPDNLLELKDLCAKMPDAYEGEDDYDHLDKWLQGLLRFMKIHCLTEVDKEQDWVLMTGTSLKGKAEHWFSLKVEHLNRIICNWTFESVIIGLY